MTKYDCKHFLYNSNSMYLFAAMQIFVFMSITILFGMYIYIYMYQPPQRPWQYKVCIAWTLAYGNLCKSLQTRGKRWDLPKLAIPPFKVMFKS